VRAALPALAKAPIALEVAPSLEDLIEMPDEPEVVVAVPEPAPVPPKKAPVKKPVPPPTPPPVQVASVAADPAVSAIGSLSTGGSSTPQSQQEAKDLIASIVKRIAALPAKKADAQKDQIRQIRHFLDQAQQALSSGDVEGAKTLATKAKLLMDDVEK